MQDRDREFANYVDSRALVMRRTAYLMCGDWHRAEDLMQIALGSAFADEPPLGIDRGEVIRQGRTRLMRRRLALTSAMAVGVTGLVLGAAMLTSARPSGYGGGEVLPAAPPGSCQEQNLVDAAGTAGLYVSADERPVDAKPMTCPPPEVVAACEERTVGRIKVQLVTQRESDGSISYSGISERVDGIWVEVISHNMASYQSNSPGKRTLQGPPTRPEPALDIEQVAMIATLPGLTF